MEDLIKLKTAISLIAFGLYEKERQKEDGKYYYSPKLMHGINIFQSLNYKYNSKAFDFSKLHEQEFINSYAMQPVSQWFDNWENADNLNLEKQGFYRVGALVGDSGFNTFHVTDSCEDYIEFIGKDIIAEIEQRAVYDNIILLNQDEYVMIRKFFIEHPIITNEELRGIKLSFSNNNNALQAIENAYEEIVEDCFVCPKCGWTLQKEKIGMRCQNSSCSDIKYNLIELKKISGNAARFRLKKGVMKYIAVPGKLEIEIYDYCKKNKVSSSLWPEMDKYDIGITFPNGEEWAIDAKAVRVPYFLKEKIIEDGGFPQGEYARGFYVIPDEFANDRPDYTEIINRQLERIGNDKIRCIKLRELKQEIRERGKQNEKHKKEV